MTILNPRVDFAFKKLFGSEENKDILISFINAVVSKEDQVVEVVLLNPYNNKDHASDRLSILDIKATDEKGRQYNIEMQITDKVEPAIKKAFSRLNTLSLDKYEREVYEARLKWLRDEDASLQKALEKGIEQGIEQGIERIAINMLQQDVPIDQISRFTGLSSDLIYKLIQFR